MNVAPIIFLCFFIFFTAVSVKVRKQQEAAQRARRENEKEAAQNQTVQAAQRAGSRPAQPQTQPKTATQTQVKAKPGPRPAPAKETVRPKVSTVSATAVNEAKKSSPEKPAGKPVYREEETHGPIVTWNQNSVLQGIVLSEILGKPKALRNK